jgi:hypothetical protein
MSLRAFASILSILCLAVTNLATAAEQAKLETIDSQPSWILESPQVRLAVTKVGGQMAPVTFLRDSGKPVQPYHVSPWQNEGLQDLPAPVLTALRGDWFCLPFGGNGDEYRHEKHPPHGEVAGAEWSYVDTKHDGGRHTLVLAFEPQARKGKIVKELTLVDGHNAVYSRHVVTGFAGPAPCGHHATLAMPDEPGVFRVSTSPIDFGMTNPSRFSDPTKREYQSLAIAALSPRLFYATATAESANLMAFMRFRFKESKAGGGGAGGLGGLLHRASSEKEELEDYAFTDEAIGPAHDAKRSAGVTVRVMQPTCFGTGRGSVAVAPAPSDPNMDERAMVMGNSNAILSSRVFTARNQVMASDAL